MLKSQGLNTLRFATREPQAEGKFMHVFSLIRFAHPGLKSGAEGRSSTEKAIFFLTQERTNGKIANSLQGGKVVR